MLTNHDIHKRYIDRQHRIVRRLLMLVLVIIAIAAGTIIGLINKVVKLEKQVEFYRSEKHIPVSWKY